MSEGLLEGRGEWMDGFLWLDHQVLGGMCLQTVEAAKEQRIYFKQPPDTLLPVSRSRENR